jgi:hypothetical protein
MSAERELDEIKVTYLEAHEAGQAPALEELIARHPQCRDELVDFITTLMEVERALHWVPEPPGPSASTRGLREQAVLRACAAGTLREALVAAGVSREQAAAMINVPVSFIVRVERGRLVPDGDEPVAPTFVARLGKVLRRTSDEVLEILRETFTAPAARRSPGHARGAGQPAAGERQAPQPFRALLAGCEDLTSVQRHEWLGPMPRVLDEEERQR